MKKLAILLLCFSVLMSCKKEVKTTEKTGAETSIKKTAKQSDGLVLLNGNFLYYADAAVLQTPTEMYGVILTHKVDELNALVKPYKKEDTDMVPVSIRGKLSKKSPDEEGWENKVEIIEIIKVSKPDPEQNDVIKLGTK